MIPQEITNDQENETCIDLLETLCFEHELTSDELEYTKLLARRVLTEMITKYEQRYRLGPPSHLAHLNKLYDDLMTADDPESLTAAENKLIAYFRT